LWSGNPVVAILVTMKQPENNFRTLDQSPNSIEMVKPGELLEVEESLPLKLADRRAINTLIENAWDRLGEPDLEHRISKRELRGPASTASEAKRLDSTLSRLQSCKLKLRIKRDGKPYTKSISLLRSYSMPQDNSGQVLYQFEPEMVDLFEHSTTWGRLARKVMLQFRSKYALALYELMEKRRGLKWKNMDRFEIDELRRLLGVPDGKLAAYKTFKQKALNPAFREVSGLSGLNLQYVEEKKGKKVTHITVSWWLKEVDALIETETELNSPHAGRADRLADTVVVEIKPRSTLELFE
jgi:plasmid replication initiation protein